MEEEQEMSPIVEPEAELEEDLVPLGLPRGITPDDQTPSPKEESFSDDVEVGLDESPTRTQEEWPLEWRVVRDGRLFIPESIPSQEQWAVLKMAR